MSSLLAFWSGFAGIVGEVGALRYHRKQGGGSAARLVKPHLPFADGLLAGAQFRRHFLLGHAEVLAQGADALAVPLFLSGLVLVCHEMILHA